MATLILLVCGFWGRVCFLAPAARERVCHQLEFAGRARAHDIYAETSIRGGVQTWDVHDVIDLQVRYENLVLL